jgi:hypothetical protein
MMCEIPKNESLDIDNQDDMDLLTKLMGADKN